MIRLHLSSLSPWNSTYSTEEGHLLFKAEEISTNYPRKVAFYRALPDLTLPTSERQLWEERHFFETHASPQREHPELDGQGSGFTNDGLIMEESRETYCGSTVESNASLYEFPLQAPTGSMSTRRTRSPSPSRTMHSETHPFWTKEHWVHFADMEYHQVHSTKFNVSGREFAASEFFEKKGWVSKSRAFTAWDGNKYRWDLKDRNVKLYRCTNSAEPEHAKHPELLVAEFIAATIVAAPRRITPPTLLIYTEGEAIIDLIVVTFVYGELAAREGVSGNQMLQTEKRQSWKGRESPASTSHTSGPQAVVAAN